MRGLRKFGSKSKIDGQKEGIDSFILQSTPYCCGCKYFVNFENLISENEVPGGIRTYLGKVQQKPNYSSIEFSSDKEYVTIDGIQYKKIQ